MNTNYKRIIYDKLFPVPPHKNYRNLMIDDESVSYITTPSNSDIITAIIDSHIPDTILRSDINIFDGTACVGGDSISFGRSFGSVVASEIDEERYYMLVNNLLEYELYNVVPVNMDCIKLYERLNFIDIMYFDPPWGGKHYKNGENLRLTISSMYIDELIIGIFNEHSKYNLIVQIVALKLPKNYDLKSLYKNTKHLNITIYLYELHKMYVIIIKKNNAWSTFNN
jgi:16S rRNA G966 N2-methylase RsmD